jgi:hypothetical protein
VKSSTAVAGNEASATPLPTKAALIATLVITGAALAEFVRRGPEAAIDPQLAAGFLWVFSALFLLRVVGQLYVRLRRPAWLPPTEEWNLTPYRLLLPAQIAILSLMAWLDVAFSLGEGVLVEPRPRLGEALLVFSYVYAGVMALRYVVRMTRMPSERWFGGTIPIVFHFVLASYVYVLGSYHASY